MCEFLERARLRDTPTEEVREWSTMTHRVVELCGPFPTPDDMRVELWLHEESATRLLDMCDRIDAEFDRTKTENAKLRKLLSCALISAGYSGRRFLDTYLQEEEGTTLLQELRSLGIEVEQ